MNAFPPASGNRFLVLMRQAVAKYGKPNRWSPQTRAEVQRWVLERLNAGESQARDGKAMGAGE